MGWTVALKVIRSELLESHAARQQFLLEMEAMAQLDHPNIVQFCDVDQAGKTFYCAMEYIEGTDLGKYVRLTGPLPPWQAADFVRQTALGLQHAHEHNLVHRDIKPVNLFLTNQPASPPGPALRGGPPTGRGPSLIKILDWGLARLRLPNESRRASARTSGIRAVLGTADYLAPDQARDADAADARSDIYSLGCTFYYLLTGQPPFPGGNLPQKLMAHQQAEPAPVESFNPEVPAALTTVLSRMMAKKPQDRFQTPAAVALALVPFCRRTAPPTMGPWRDKRSAPAPEPTLLPDDTPMPGASRPDSQAPSRPHAVAFPPSPQSPSQPRR
jgi:serine/threonine-protein kinase